MTRALRAVPVLAVFCVPAGGQTQTATHGAFLDGAAREAWSRSDLQGALQRFLEAYRVAPTAGLAYNVAIAAQGEGRPDLAFDFLQQHQRLVDAAERARMGGDRRPWLASVCASVPANDDLATAAGRCAKAIVQACGRTSEDSAGIVCRSLDAASPWRLAEVAQLWATGRDVARRLATLAPHLALVSVESEPADATVYLDRTELGDLGRTPLVAAVPPGPHRALLDLPDHLPGVLEFNAKSGETVPLVIDLPERKGALFFAPADPTATAIAISASGEQFPLEPRKTTRMPVGRYTLEFTVGDRHETRFQRVEEGPSTEVRLLTLRTPRYGKLLIRTSHPGANVFLDDAPVGATPLVLDRVVAGTHKVRVTRHRAAPRQVETVVRSGDATLLDLDADDPRATN